MPRETRNTYTSSSHTRVLVSFHTDPRNGLNIEEPVLSHPALGTILSVHTKKGFGAASGTFTIKIKKNARVLGARSALRDLWRDPEDVWVRIKWSVDGQIIDGLLGMIDTIRETTGRSEGGRRSETYEITGRDFGKVFEITEVWVNFFHNPERVLRSVRHLTSTGLENLIGTPAHFIRVLLEIWISNNGAAEAQFVLPRSLGGVVFDSILSKDGIENMSGFVNGQTVSPTLFQIDQAGGKLWDIMQEYSNGLMNELYVDLVPRGSDLENMVPTVILRERPFPIRSDDNSTTSHTKWNGLRTHTLLPGDIKSRDIAKGSSANRYNYWSIHMQGVGTEGFNVEEILQRGVEGASSGVPGNIPIWNEASIRKHGARRYMAQTRYLPFYKQSEVTADDEAEHFFRLAARWLKKVHDWFVVAPFELSGQLTTTRVQPEIRIGHRIKEVRAEGTIVYYVEEVSNRYAYEGGGSTTLMVTRGEYEDDDLLDFVYEEYDRTSGALTEFEQCFVVDPQGPLLPTEVVSQELIDQLARGCVFRAPRINIGEGDPTSTGLGEITDEVGFDFVAEPRLLEQERDGTQLREEDPDQQLSRETTVLDDSEPTVGEPGVIPPPGETADSGRRPNDPPLDQQAAERGQPIDDGFDPSNDPLFGLTEEELSGF